MTKATLKQKLRYRFDNTMSKGPIALILWLAIITFVLILFATVIIMAFQIFPIGENNEAEAMTAGETLWQSLMRSMDAGTVAGDTGWSYRIIMMVVTLGGIFILSTLIGILSSGIDDKLEQLRKGRSFVVEENHQLILGWNSKVFTIISELAIANENQKNPKIVILANEDKTVMEDEIKDKCPQIYNSKVICRSGNPNDIVDLNIVNPQDSKSIIILAPEDTEDADAQTIKNLLAIINNPSRKEGKYHIVAEMKDEKNLQIGEMVGKDEVELLLTDDLISRIMVQTCRQSGLSVVYTSLTEFDGDEIYIVPEPKLIGKTFGDAIFMYKDSTIIGIQFPDGKTQMNPPMDTIFEEGSNVIGITEDDDTLIIDNANYSVNEAVLQNLDLEEIKKENTLILEWNKKGPSILRELKNYVLEGSNITVVSDSDEVKDEVKELMTLESKLNVSFIQGDTTDRPLLDSLDVDKYTHIIVLSNTTKENIQAADSQTLITLLHLRDILNIKGVEISIVSEIMDVRNRDLASVTKADDFVVSDNLISQLISMVSESKDLMRVFEDMFDAEGSEIYLKPVSDYIKPGATVDFYTLVESAKRKNEIAIGYRIVKDQFDPAKSFGIKINPLKSDNITFTPNDKLIVFAED